MSVEILAEYLKKSKMERKKETMIEKFHPVTHIIFDMDGLLLNTEPRYEKAIVTICEKYGATYSEEARQNTIGRTDTDCAKAAITHCNLPITLETFLELMELEYPIVFENVDYMPGAEKLVKHFHSNRIPMAIATNSKKSNFQYKSKGREEFFKSFDHIVIGFDDPEVKNGKPDPDIYLVAASRFSNPPTDMKNVLVFEDSIPGVQAGLAAGMQVVWVPDPCFDITTQDATLVIPSLDQFIPEHFRLPAGF